jgi:hypothetical protein
MRGAVVLLLLGGCDQLFNLNHLRAPDPGTDVDAALGTVIDASLTCVGGNFYGEYGANDAGLLKICVPMTVTTPVTLGGDIDTDSAFCDVAFAIDSYGTEVCVKWAADIMIDTIHATGSRALVVVATNRMTINGVVDVASHQGGGSRGAGANWKGCPANQGPSSTVSSNGGGGGAGGSFGARGGSGGANVLNEYTGGRPPVVLDRVRGGCEGGNGGNGAYASAGGFGGRAGGAVYLIAGTAIDIGPSATINASGQGGHGGALASIAYSGPGGGGGGGGSGGLIALDSRLVSVASTAVVFADGGGGGAGAAFSTPGGDGSDPDRSITTVAGGGTGSLYGGKGGAGGIAGKSAASGASGKSGGGGGGAVGYIAIFTSGPAVTTGQFSPTPVTVVGAAPQ